MSIDKITVLATQSLIFMDYFIKLNFGFDEKVVYLQIWCSLFRSVAVLGYSLFLSFFKCFSKGVFLLVDM